MEEEELSKRFDVVHARLQKAHPAVSLVLQCHLVIEDHINEILEIQTKHFSQIKDLSFSAKFRLLKALTDRPLNCSGYKVIESINKLRNEVSHHAWDRNYESLKKAFFNLMGLLRTFKELDQDALKKMKPDEYLLIAAVYACGTLHHILEDVKNERSVRDSR